MRGRRADWKAGVQLDSCLFLDASLQSLPFRTILSIIHLDLNALEASNLDLSFSRASRGKTNGTSQAEGLGPDSSQSICSQ